MTWAQLRRVGCQLVIESSHGWDPVFPTSRTTTSFKLLAPGTGRSNSIFWIDPNQH